MQWEYQPALPPPFPVSTNTLTCEKCGEEIQPGERCANIFLGKAGEGPKSGRLMVVEHEEFKDMGVEEASVHLRCLVEYVEVTEAMVDYQDGFDDVNPDPSLDMEVHCVHCGVLLDIEACCEGCATKLDPDWE